MDFSVENRGMLLSINGSGTFSELLLIFRIHDGNVKCFIRQMNAARHFQTAFFSKSLKRKASNCYVYRTI
jgi:hypothetical protein